MILTYKYRIKDRTARKALAQYAYAVNQVWNYCNAIQREVESRYQAGGPTQKWPGQFDLQKLTRGASELLGIYSKTVEAVCRQYAQSRDKTKHSLRFRASSGPKRALGWVPFHERGARQIQGNSVTYLGKRFRFWEGNRPLPKTNKGGAFVEDARGRWYVCFHIKVSEGIPTSTSKIGIDLGLKSLATCSNGEVITAPKIYLQYEGKLATAQRAGNKKRVKAIHAKIKNCRKDFLHKASTKLVRENELVAVGNVDSVKLAKTRMAKSVMDAGWSMFRAQLRYKCQQARVVYLDIDEKFTTQTCSQCGALPPERPKGIAGLGIRVWDCSVCGTHLDRDVNAAQNILALALSAQRRVDESRLADG